MGHLISGCSPMCRDLQAASLCRSGASLIARQGLPSPPLQLNLRACPTAAAPNLVEISFFPSFGPCHSQSCLFLRRIPSIDPVVAELIRGKLPQWWRRHVELHLLPRAKSVGKLDSWAQNDNTESIITVTRAPCLRAVTDTLSCPVIQA